MRLSVLVLKRKKKSQAVLVVGRAASTISNSYPQRVPEEMRQQTEMTSVEVNTKTE